MRKQSNKTVQLPEEFNLFQLPEAVIPVIKKFNLCPPSDTFYWFATINDDKSPAFITLYAFKGKQEPEIYFIWMDNYEDITYWLNQLYQFETIRKHILNVIFSHHFPEEYFQVCIKKIKALRQNKFYQPEYQ